MNLTNYHSHSTFCDGRSSMEEMVQAAIVQGFVSYGFSSHAPLPFHTRWNMDSSNMNAYVAEAKRLKDKYSDQIELYCGLEIDFLDDNYNSASEIFQSINLDYRIGSLHTIVIEPGHILEIDCKYERFKEIVDEYFSGDAEDILRVYVERLMRMVEIGGFDIVGHADKMHYLADMYCKGLSSKKWYVEAMKEYFSLIVSKGIMIEMNTKKYVETGLFFPDASWYEFLNSIGAKIVVNSDSHSCDKINSGRIDGLRHLVSCGYKSVMEMHDGQWTEVAIDLS